MVVGYWQTSWQLQICFDSQTIKISISILIIYDHVPIAFGFVLSTMESILKQNVVYSWLTGVSSNNNFVKEDKVGDTRYSNLCRFLFSLNSL